MKEPYSIKTRRHHGTKSLDLTIPTDLKKEYKINEGDIFVLTANEEKIQDKTELVLTYRRIFHNAKVSKK